MSDLNSLLKSRIASLGYNAEDPELVKEVTTLALSKVSDGTIHAAGRKRIKAIREAQKAQKDAGKPEGTQEPAASVAA